MTDQEIKERLDRIERAVLVNSKEILTLSEVCQYTGLSKARIYALTSSREIPHYKQGRLFFKRTEIESWLTSNKVVTKAEIEKDSILYCMSHPAPTR